MKYRARLAKAVGRIVQWQEVDDVLQETFLRTFKAASRTTITYPQAFLLKTATNVAINRTMRAERRLSVSIEDFPQVEVYLSSESLDADYEAREQYQLLCQAVDALPARCREVFILRKVYGFSQKEISSLLGISESTVEKHIAKGLLLCKSSFERWTNTDLSDKGESAKAGKTEDRADAEGHSLASTAHSPCDSGPVGREGRQRAVRC